MSNYQMHPKEFLVGATIGSLLGSITALLIAPKAGNKLRDDICDTYCDLSDKTCGMTNQLSKKAKSFANNFKSQPAPSDWASKAKNLVNCFAGSAKNSLGLCDEECEESNAKDIAIGVAIGALVGAAVGFLVAPKAGNELVKDIADTYSDVSDRTHEFAHDVSKKGSAFAKTASKQANRWVDIAKQAIDELSDNQHDIADNLVNQAKSLFNDSRINEVIDWASVGYRVWNGLKSKR
jgi:gas vesicle protein